MKFAHFSHVWGKPNMSGHERYEQLWRELILCDDIAFDFSFCVEHHFRPDESWMSSPALYAVAGSARTKRLRVGVMGFVVPLHHPLRLAEEIAIVDQMSGGRFECPVSVLDISHHSASTTTSASRLPSSLSVICRPHTATRNPLPSRVRISTPTAPLLLCRRCNGLTLRYG